MLNINQLESGLDKAETLEDYWALAQGISSATPTQADLRKAFYQGAATTAAIFLDSLKADEPERVKLLMAEIDVFTLEVAHDALDKITQAFKEGKI